MRRLPHLSTWLLAAGALAPAAGAQLAQSASYRLDDLAFGGGGGGEASLGFAAFVAMEPMSGAEVASPAFRATLGFLGAWNPEPSNAPVIFGVTPDCGPLAGGTPTTISGLNFDKFGAGPTVAVNFGGAAASGVIVSSDTLLTCTTPPGTAGDKNVTVSSSFGSDVLANGFHYDAGLVVYGTGTPGCTGPELLGASSSPKIGNAAFQLTCDHVPPNALGLGIVGHVQDVAGSDPLSFGILFHMSVFDPGLVGLDFSSNAAGVGFAAAPLPNNPAIVGVTMYAQVIWSWGLTCPLPPFGLSSSRGLQFTFEP